MKILTVLESGSWADYHIAGSLEEMGHDVARFFYGDGVGEFYGRNRCQERQRKNSDLLTLARRLTYSGQLDLIFCYVYDDFLMPSYVKALADLNVPMVNFNVDMVSQWYRQIRTAKYFTRILCAQRANMQNMAHHGARVMYFPMAARFPKVETAESVWQPAAPVTFVGTPMPCRTGVLGRLHEAGVPLAVYGKFWLENRQATPERNWEKTLSDLRHYGWPRLRGEGQGGLLRALADRLPHRRAQTGPDQVRTLPADLIHGFVPNGSMSAMFRNSRVNLGFTRMIGEDPDAQGVNQVKLRDFEVPMAGGFYLVEKAPDYDSLFKPGVEVETWSGTGELLEKIRYYLAHDAERQAIAKAGAARAQAEHSWERRFRGLFDELGLAG